MKCAAISACSWQFAGKIPSFGLRGIEQAERWEGVEVVRIEREEGVRLVREADGGEPGVVGAFSTDGAGLHERFPEAENVRRVGEENETRLDAGDFHSGGFGCPAEAVGRDGARGDGPEFDQILRADAQFVAFREQAGDRLDGAVMVNRTRIGDAEPDVRIGENAHNGRRSILVDGVAARFAQADCGPGAAGPGEKVGAAIHARRRGWGVEKDEHADIGVGHILQWLAEFEVPGVGGACGGGDEAVHGKSLPAGRSAGQSADGRYV